MIILTLSILSYGGDGKFEKRQLSSYKISLSQEFESALAKIVVKNGKDKVFEEAEIGNHYYFGNNFDQASDGPDLDSIHDITGKGFPNLVVSNWIGGAHCCHFLHTFELGKKFKKLVTVEANSSTICLVDLDHDRVLEIEFWGEAIDYQFASFAGSPGGRVVLKFQKDHYEVATHIMRKTIPTVKKIKNMKKRILTAFKKEEIPGLPCEFLNTLISQLFRSF